MADGENLVRTRVRTLTTEDAEDHGGRTTGGSLLRHGVDTGRNSVRNSVRNIFEKRVTLCRAALGGTLRLPTRLRSAPRQNGQARECVRPYVFFACFVLLGALVACSKPPQPETTETPQPTGLESIPAPDPSKYPNFSDLTSWKNPYLVVREDGVGFVDLSNREIHVLTPEQIPAELVALPLSAWPYGRIVLVAQAVPKNPSEQTKADLRKNRALLLGTLKDLDVQVREAP
jgi:hypothetical protein